MATPDSLVMVAPLTNSTDLEIGIGTGTFTRSTVATYIQNGILKTAAINEARFESNGYLTEGARTNLVTQSENFTSWTETGTASAQITAELAPDGVTATFSYTVGNVAGDFVRPNSLPAFTGDVAVSFFFKPSTATTLFIRVIESGGQTATLEFNQTTFSISTQTNVSNIVFLEIANGWTKCSFLATGYNSINVVQFRFAGSTTAQGTTFLFGIQGETEDFSTSYIKTTGSSVTRAAETLTYDAANFPTLNTEYSYGITARSQTPVGTLTTAFNITGISSQNYIAVVINDFYRFRVAGISSIDVNSIARFNTLRIVGTWLSGGSQNIYVNTVLGDTDAAVNTSGTVTNLLVGSRFGIENFFGNITDIRVYSTELTQEEINDELITDVSLNSLINSTIDTPINTFLN